jgi:hypothetical protein
MEKIYLLPLIRYLWATALLFKKEHFFILLTLYYISPLLLIKTCNGLEFVRKGKNYNGF